MAVIVENCMSTLKQLHRLAKKCLMSESARGELASSITVVKVLWNTQESGNEIGLSLQHYVQDNNSQ